MIKKDRPNRIDRTDIYKKDNKYFLSVYKVDPRYKAKLDKLADEVWEYVFGMLVESMSKDGLLILNKNDITNKFGDLDKIVIPEDEYSDYTDLQLIEENIYHYLFRMIKDKTIAMDYVFKAKCPRNFELSMGIFRNESCWVQQNSNEIKEMINVYKSKHSSDASSIKEYKAILKILQDVYVSFINGKDTHSLDKSDIINYATSFGSDIDKAKALDLVIAVELELKKFKLRLDRKGNGIEIRNWYSI